MIIKNNKYKIMITQETNFMDMNRISKYLCHSKSFVYKKVRTNEIPHYKMGKRTLFDREEIDQWVKSGMRPVIQTNLPKLPRF